MRFRQKPIMLLIAFALVMAIAIVVWMQPRGPSPAEQLAAIDATRAVPDANNAAIAYMDLLNVYVDDDIPGGSKHYTRTLNDPWCDADAPDVSAWLKSYEPVMQQLETASRIPDFVIPIHESHDRLPTIIDKPTSIGYSSAFIELVSGVRQWGYLLRRSAFNDLGEGRVLSAVEKAQTCLRMGRHLRGQPDYLCFSLGEALEEHTLYVFAYVLVHYEVESPRLEQLLLPEDIEAIFTQQYRTMTQTGQIVDKAYMKRFPIWSRVWGRLQVWWMYGRLSQKAGELTQWAHIRHLMRYRGHRILVELRRIKNETGDWPTKLPSPNSLLSENDWIDPLSQKPFVYGRLGDSFYLYSIGDNGRDEQGRFNMQTTSQSSWDDRMIWPPRNSEIYRAWQANLD